MYSYNKEITQTHNKWFEYAGLIAQTSDMLFRLGCVSTFGGKMIAYGCNTKNTYSRNDNFCDFSCSCHAEITVIRKTIKILGEDKMKKVNLYVARMDSNNKFQNSAPCFDCMRQIKRLKIKNIIFKDDISIKIVNPVYYDTEHRTFGYYYLKSVQDSPVIQRKQKLKITQNTKKKQANDKNKKCNNKCCCKKNYFLIE
tara:strand:- start:3126 stop:3719 length:594 start_codon:yes stop_codon:yes gene_type:complete